MKRRAFTLIELMAAVGMLALIISFTSVIFRFGIDAHRVSVANAEIMRNARAITEQLNHDFQGLRKDAPMFIWFRQHSSNSKTRYDQIMFFASGDYSTLQLYDKVANSEPLKVNDTITNTAKVIRGNLARIQYTQATNANDDDIKTISSIDRNLSRRVHILFNNDKNGWQLQGWPDFNSFDWDTEDYYEHDTITMADWRDAQEADYKSQVLPNMIVDHLPKIDKTDPDTLHLLLSERISSFAVQWAYWGRDNSSDDWQLRWFPNGNKHFSNYNNKDNNSFGVYFNLADVNDITNIDWYEISDIKQKWAATSENFRTGNFPAALKFTFTVYDKNNVIAGGRTFTHIVYLDN